MTQEEINKGNALFQENLPDKDKEKFKAVSDALEILNKAGVYSYLFTDLPAPTLYGSGIYQWNNLNTLWKDESPEKMRALLFMLHGMTNHTESIIRNLYYCKSNIETMELFGELALCYYLFMTENKPLPALAKFDNLEVKEV